LNFPLLVVTQTKSLPSEPPHRAEHAIRCNVGQI
jgi:hypothetical protein